MTIHNDVYCSVKSTGFGPETINTVFNTPTIYKHGHQSKVSAVVLVVQIQLIVTQVQCCPGLVLTFSDSSGLC